MSHAAVKDALVERLTDGLAGWLTDWPDVWVAAFDLLPEDDARWPFAIVRSTNLSSTTRQPDGSMRCVFACQIDSGTRSTSGERDDRVADASALRDELSAAVFNALLHAPQLVAETRMRVVHDTVTQQTSAVVVDAKGRAIAIGTTQFDVSADLPIPPPSDTDDDPTITDADVTLTAHDVATDPLT